MSTRNTLWYVCICTQRVHLISMIRAWMSVSVWFITWKDSTPLYTRDPLITCITFIPSSYDTWVHVYWVHAYIRTYTCMNTWIMHKGSLDSIHRLHHSSRTTAQHARTQSHTHTNTPTPTYPTIHPPNHTRKYTHAHAHKHMSCDYTLSCTIPEYRCIYECTADT